MRPQTQTATSSASMTVQVNFIPAEERLLDLFEGLLARMTPDERELAVEACEGIVARRR